MNAMKEALLEKGYVDPKKRLAEIADEALQNSRGSWDGAEDALVRGIRGDAALLWEMLAPFWKEAVKLVIQPAAERARAENARNKMNPPRAINVGSSASGQTRPDNQPVIARRAADSSSGGAGHSPDDDQQQVARPIRNKSWDRPSASGAGQAQQPVPVPGRVSSSDGLGHRNNDSQTRHAQPIRSLTEKARRPVMSLAETRAAMRATSEVARASLLETFPVNGQPLGKVTVKEARQSGHKRTLEGRFLLLLTSGIQQGDHLLVGKCCNASMADAAMQQAKAESCNV